MGRRVPRKEAELVSLANVIISGLKANPDIFSKSPLDYKQLKDIADKFNASNNNAAQKKADYMASLLIKKEDFKFFHKSVLDVVNYCVRIAKKDKTILAKLGLKPNKEKLQELPGQCLDLTVLKQEIGSVTLKWKRPKGGNLKGYVIQRKESDASLDAWENVWTEMTKQATIKKQPKGKIFDYRVLAMNKKGLGASSNIVTVKF